MLVGFLILVQNGLLVRILIVDDQPELAELLAWSLRENNIPALAFTSALQLLRMIRTNDVLVTDYAMPEMTGLEMARQAYHGGWRGPLFLMSGTFDPRSLAFDSPPVRFFLPKPFPVKDLIRMLPSGMPPPD